MSNICDMVIALGTLAGALLIGVTLYLEKKWQRKKYAIDLLSAWNDYTADHAKEILTMYPKLRDGEMLSRPESRMIYLSIPSNTAVWNVRFQIVELLNHAEAMAVAIDNNVAAEEIIGKSVNKALCAWYENLEIFLEEAEKINGYQPWKEFVEYARKRKQYKCF